MLKASNCVNNLAGKDRDQAVKDTRDEILRTADHTTKACLEAKLEKLQEKE